MSAQQENSGCLIWFLLLAVFIGCTEMSALKREVRELRKHVETTGNTR